MAKVNYPDEPQGQNQQAAPEEDFTTKVGHFLRDLSIQLPIGGLNPFSVESYKNIVKPTKIPIGLSNTRNLLSMGGATAGAGIGSRAGGGGAGLGFALGSMGGSYLGQALEEKFPDWFKPKDQGPSGDPTGEALKDTLINSLFHGAAKAAGPVANTGLALMKRGFNKMAGNPFVDDYITEAVGQYLEKRAKPLEPRTLQAFQDPRSKLGENLSVGDTQPQYHTFESSRSTATKADLIKKQQGLLQDEEKQLGYTVAGVQPGTFVAKTSEARGKAALGTLEKNQADWRAKIKKDYEPLDQAAQAMTARGPIPGPISMTNSQQWAQSYLDKFNEEISGVPDPVLKTKLTNLTARLASAVADPVKSWSEVKQTRTLINDYLQDKTRWKYFDSILNNLQKAMSQDIEQSIPKWGNTPAEGQKLLAQLHKANNTTSKYYDIFNDRTYGDMMKGREPTAIPSDLLRNYLKSPEEAALYVRAAGGRTKDIASQWWNDFQSSHRTIMGSGDTPAYLNGPAALRDYMSPDNQELIKKFTTRAQRDALEFYYRRAATVDPRLSEAGYTALHLAKDYAQIQASAFALKGLLGHGSSAMIYPTGKLAVLIGNKVWADRVMMDPKMARIAAGLMKAPPHSHEAQMLTKSLFYGLKGAQVVLENPDTGEKDVTTVQ